MGKREFPEGFTPYEYHFISYQSLIEYFGAEAKKPPFAPALQLSPLHGKGKENSLKGLHRISVIFHMPFMSAEFVKNVARDMSSMFGIIVFCRVFGCNTITRQMHALPLLTHKKC